MGLHMLANDNNRTRKGKKMMTIKAWWELNNCVKLTFYPSDDDDNPPLRLMECSFLPGRRL